jgi:hypothetical protein
MGSSPSVQLHGETSPPGYGAGPCSRRRSGYCPARAAVAQPVEHRIRNAGVGGSNPFRGTNVFNDLAFCRGTPAPEIAPETSLLVSICNLLLKIWMVVPVHVSEHLWRHSQEPSGLPQIAATLHEPGRSRVAHHVGRHLRT